MANTLSASYSLSADYTLAKDPTIGSVSAQGAVGSDDFPEMTHDWEDGTGDGQANEVYSALLTIAASSTTSLDLSGAAIENPFEEAIAFTTIVAVFLAVVDPASTKRVRLGPQNVANAAQLWFGGTGATVYQEIYDDFAMVRKTGGWTITAGTGDLLPISNPDGVDVDVAILIIGRK